MNIPKPSMQTIVNSLVIFTAVGTLFLIIAFFIATSNRNGQIEQQIEQTGRLVEQVERIARENQINVERHRESALRQHCAEARLETLGDKLDAQTRTLLRIACTH